MTPPPHDHHQAQLTKNKPLNNNMSSFSSRNCLAALLTVSALTSSWASGVTLQELEARLNAQEQRIESQEQKLRHYEARLRELGDDPAQEAKAPDPLHLKRRAAVAPNGAGGAFDLGTDEIDASFLGSGSTASDWWERTQLGGYGELHLNMGDKDQIDFHRFVLFVNHRFSDRFKLYSELELEHSLSGDGEPGEVELEQAYLDYLGDSGWSAKAGLFLLPLGFLNETHEPDTFYGVERTPIERNIIPTTWWEGGLGVSKSFENGLSVDAAFHSGLNVSTDLSSSNAFRIRSGRQKVAEADASDWAATARLRYRSPQGIDASIFGHFQSDIAPENDESNRAIFYGGTIAYQRGGLGIRALAGRWDINGASFDDNGADEQWGWYFEPSYVWKFRNDQRIGLFTRYGQYRFARGADNGRGGDFDNYSVGINYWPVERVVLKADYNLDDKDGGGSEETFNFGVGYSF